MDEPCLRLEISLRRLRRAAALVLPCLLIGGLASELASENVTLTTYYPAPTGIYTRMITTSRTDLARDAGNVTVGADQAAGAGSLNVNGGISAANIYASDVCASGRCLKTLSLKTETYSTNYSSVVGRSFTCPIAGQRVVFCETFLSPSGAGVCGTAINGNSCQLGGCTAPPGQTYASQIVCTGL